MRIVRDDQLATWTLCPSDTEEEEGVRKALALLSPGVRLTYAGRARDPLDPEICIVKLHVGGQLEKKLTTEGCITIAEQVFVGGIPLDLRGETAQDQQEVRHIRNTCYFGAGGLIFLGTIDVSGRPCLICTAMYCQRCGAAMIDSLACEWSTCSACAAVCDHAYIHGRIHSNGVDIGMGEFCQICGRSKSKEPHEPKPFLPEVGQEPGAPTISLGRWPSRGPG